MFIMKKLEVIIPLIVGIALLFVSGIFFGKGVELYTESALLSFGIMIMGLLTIVGSVLSFILIGILKNKEV